MDGEKVQDVLVYINRLSVAKKRVDKRIATLSGEQFDFVSKVRPFHSIN
jgi:sorting nexin-25